MFRWLFPCRTGRPKRGGMYLDFYGLREEPFGVTPDPRYLYLSATHREALASLLYGVSVGRGFMALIARPGMGKTTLLFQLLQHFERSARTVFLFQTQNTPRDFLRSLLADLGVDSDDGDLVRMHSKLNEVLLRESRSERQFIVVIDEAQNLEDPVLEVVRMLSNFETSRDKLMQIILAGQPQLADKLASTNLIQLRQRISLYGHLKPFDATETNLYIDHRLCVAGYDFHAPLFTRQARALIASGSEGIPRNINNICFNALSLGCALKQKTIDRDVILEVLSDLDIGSLAAKSTVIPKIESEPKRKPAHVPSRDKGQSPLRTLFPRFAVAGALLATLSWPLVDAVRNANPIHPPQVNASAESASVGLAAQPVSGKPTESLDSGSPSTPPNFRSQSLQTSQEAAQPKVADASFSSERPASTLRVVRVRPYETLNRICTDNFGRCSTEIMEKIFELNPSLVNPDSLRPGQELRLPAAPPATGDADQQIERSSNPPSAKADRP
jgi:general secretion pathway protein A